VRKSLSPSLSSATTLRILAREALDQIEGP
jgi:hypothetical protein